MSIKTVSLIFLQPRQPQESAACAYAIAMAGRHGAHLAVCIGILPLYIPMDVPSPEVAVWAEKENTERKAAANAAGVIIAAAAAGQGVAASFEVDSDAYDPIFPHLVQFARTSDLAVVQAPADGDGMQHEMVLELLMASGVPIVVVPGNWKQAGPPKTVVVAWDGGRPAARAVRDAMPLLEEAETVEIVSIHGEKDLPGQVAGEAIAKHLSRHCKRVVASGLPAQNRDVADTIRRHAHLVHADLIVMGGYGHSRMREFVMGGVTRAMLKHVEIPALLTH